MKKHLTRFCELLTLVVGGFLLAYALSKAGMLSEFQDEALRWQGYGEMDIVHAQKHRSENLK